MPVQRNGLSRSDLNATQQSCLRFFHTGGSRNPGRSDAYGSMLTGVPFSTFLKKASAIAIGIRMQPCEAA